MFITGVTVSYKILDKDFGSGTEHYVSIQAQTGETSQGIPMKEQGEILESISDQLLMAYTAVQQSRYQAGELPGKEMTEMLSRVTSRHEKLVEFLHGDQE